MKNILTLTIGILVATLNVGCGDSGTQPAAEGKAATSTKINGNYVRESIGCTDGKMKEESRTRREGYKFELAISEKDITVKQFFSNSTCEKTTRAQLESLTADRINTKGTKVECNKCTSGECNPVDRANKIESAAYKFDGSVLTIFDDGTRSCENPKAQAASYFRKK